jgi:tetratricopeptide (TPR) repeat protein
VSNVRTRSLGYAEAVDAYSTAVNRHPHSPEVLEAYVQIAECYRRLNQPSEARATIEQAKVVLKRLGTNAPYKETTNYTSEGWIQRLEWLSRL